MMRRQWRIELTDGGEIVTAPFGDTGATLQRPDRRPLRRIVLSAAEFRLMNPNTRTAPVRRTRQDADLFRFLYERVPVLVNECTCANPWGIRYYGMPDMSSDSNLFKTVDDLAAIGASFGNSLGVVGPSESEAR